jgi:hypothetical protein
LLISIFGALEADALIFPYTGAPPRDALEAFAPDLVIGEIHPRAPCPISFSAIMSET